MAELPHTRVKRPQDVSFPRLKLVKGFPRASAKRSQTDSYIKKIGRYRVFDPTLPEDIIAHVNVEVDMRRLRPKGEVRGQRCEGRFFEEFRKNDEFKKLFGRIRRDTERKVETWLSPEPECQDAPYTPESVLQGLGDLNITDARRRELVIRAELLRFGEEQKPKLLSVLWNFTRAYRDSNELDDLIAVGSAIRKYVANMETGSIGAIATLLEAGHAGTPPLDVKIEIVKMIYRSFEANPPTKPDPEPQLAERVYEIARAYLDPNVLPDGKNATVAMLAVQALVAMLSKRASEALATVNKLPQAHHWFRDQLRRRLINLRERWAGDPKAARNLSKLMVSIVEQ